MSEYDSSIRDEESADEESACDVGEIPSLEQEANFLLRRVSRLGKSIRFNSSLFFFIFFVMELWDRCHFFFYAFVDIAIRLFATDLSLLIRFSVIEVKQKEVVTVTSVRYSCKTSKNPKTNR